MTFDESHLAILVCPLTRTRLRYQPETQELVSDSAGLAYPIRDGMAVLLIEEARQFETADPPNR